MFDSRTPRVRSFNRLVSQTIGALQDHYLGRDRPLGEARLLFEIGTRGADVKDLRARLGLDSGYLSRLLRSLERQGFVVPHKAAHDKRVRRSKLTRSGLAELKELDRRSDQLAQSILDPLSESQRAHLINAMEQVERLLSASAAKVAEESPKGRDSQYCLSEYFKELSRRFDGGFDPAQSESPTPENFVPPDGTFLVIRLNGLPVGCGAFKRIPPNTAYLKRMWIDPNLRGLGLGKRLLQELEKRARDIGYHTARLETNKSLNEARKLYKSAGYSEVAPFNSEQYAHHWFEKSLRSRSRGTG